MTHPLSPSLIDFDSDLTKVRRLANTGNEKNIIKSNSKSVERHEYLLQFFTSKLPKKTSA